MIRAGRITVNGTRAELGRKIDAAKDVVEVDGSRWPLQAGLVYYLLNKPEGVVSTADDPEGRTTVLDLVDPEVRLWPVGRLDIGTEGAIVITNDGDLTHALTHPRHGVPKTYLALVGGRLSRPTARRLATGIELEDGPTAPARVEIVDRRAAATLVTIELTEGRNRQVRRMFDAVGHPVQRLVRTAIGPVRLGRLKPGAWRRLTPVEIAALYGAAGAENRIEST